MPWILAGGAVLGGLLASRGSGDAADTMAGSSDAATAEQRRQFDIATGLARPAIDSGNTARDQLMRLLGLSPAGGQQGAFGNAADRIGPGLNAGIRGAFRQAGAFGGAEGAFSLNRDPRGGAFGGPQGITGGSGGSQDPMDIIRNTPGYEFQLEQGARALNANRSNAGPSGGELTKDFARFNQGTASSFYQDYANRLAGLAGSAQTASTTLGNQGIASGQIIGNNLQNAGAARASGILGQSNAWGNVLNQLGGAAGYGLFDNLFGNKNNAGFGDIGTN